MIQKKVSSKGNQEFPKIFELKHDQLRWHCDEEMFKFKTTEELEPLEEIVGQERAVEAIRLGAGLKSKGYNIFVSGISGTGRLTTVKQILENVTTKKTKLFDYCYVNNFADKDSPKLIRLDQGKGKEFARAMDDCVSSLIRRLPKLFEDESFRASRSKRIEEYQVLERSILEKFDEKIKPHGFVRGQLEDDNGVTQPEVFPVINEKPVQVEDLDTFVGEGNLEKEKAEEIRKNYRQFHNEIYDLARHGMKLMKKFRTALYDNDKAAAKDIVDSELEDVLEISNDIKIKNYLDEVNKYILDNLNLFVEIESENVGNGFNDSKSDSQKGSNKEDKFRLFSVNVILDNSKTESAPIIVE
nr:AAA family ATPase [Candidatus Kapabacteria bacterium]